jgi:hypothetical protein
MKIKFIKNKIYKKELKMDYRNYLNNLIRKLYPLIINLAIFLIFLGFNIKYQQEKILHSFDKGYKQGQIDFEISIKELIKEINNNNDSLIIK